MNTSAAITVTSYELAGKLPDVYSPSMLVLDEAHLLRGRGAQRSRKLLALGQECNFRLALTGTPMWSRPRDLWMLLRILFPKYRFGSAEDFDYAYCGAFINQWGGRVNKGATRSDELKLRLGYVQLRRTKEQVATEMPKLQRNVRWVPGTVPAKRAFEAALMKRMSMYDALDATLEAKLDVAVETAIEAQRFLLFTWQKRHAHELWRRLNEDDTPCVLITGDLSHAERNAAIADATARKMGVVATIDSCGTGVDGLQHVASIGIFHALDYVPIKLAQAEARLHRIGQLNPVQWVYVAMEGTADQLVAETIVEKLDQWRGVMGKDSSTGLGDAISMQDIAVDERAALKALYAAMGE
jgi:SWI/SNF-related matrix-associated actin-dependent regulator 1 of chromatin subfamily A